MDCSSNTDSELYLFKSSFHDMVIYIIFAVFIFVLAKLSKHIIKHEYGEPLCLTLTNEEVLSYKTIIILSFILNFIMIFVWCSKIGVYKSKKLANEETLFETIMYLLFPLIFMYILWNFYYILTYGTVTLVDETKNISKYCIEISDMNLSFLKIALITEFVMIIILILMTFISTFDPFYSLVNSCTIIYI